MLSLPLFVLISAALWRHPGWALVLFWLLKPAFERLPLYILSRALFGTAPSLGECFKALPGLLKPQLLASLSWRRLSPTRSFDLPVLQLEGLGGRARQQRLNVLGQKNAAAAAWLTLTGMALEAALYLGLVSLLYLLLPAQLVENLDWQKLIQQAAGDGVWLDHLSNLLYALVLLVWEPIYVACGFTLYLNRRTALEAWDIELVFRRLRQRLTGSAYALLLAIGLVLAQPLPQVWAATTDTPATVARIDPYAPPAARLLQQPLTSTQAQQVIEGLLQAAPFENDQTVTRWRIGAEAQEQETDARALEGVAKLLKGLLDLFKPGSSLEILAHVLSVALWALVISLLVLLIWRYREWLRLFGQRLSLPQRRQRPAPQQVFGLDVAPESLPEDVASTAERLWAEHPREALGLLYRALLSRLLHDYRLALKGSHTEGEVLQRIEQLQNQDLSRFSAILTRH